MRKIHASTIGPEMISDRARLIAKGAGLIVLVWVIVHVVVLPVANVISFVQRL